MSRASAALPLLWALSACAPAPAPAPAASPPVTTAPATEAAPPDLFTATYGPARGAELAALAQRMDTLGTAAEFKAALSDAVALCAALDAALQPAIDADQTDGSPTDLEALEALLPGMSLSLEEEGTVLLTRPTAMGWLAPAGRSPEPADDAFLNVVHRSYQAAWPLGWPAWRVRHTEGAGCSPFGTGVHQELLRLVDQAILDGDLFPAELRQLRAELLADILVGDPNFPYCAALDRPTPPEAMQAEAGQILTHVTLSAEERAALERRMKAGFTVPPNPSTEAPPSTEVPAEAQPPNR